MIRIGHLYRGLLRLYPAAFQKLFLREMCGVFESRAEECFQQGKSAWIAFVVREFSTITKGACIMRVGQIFAAFRGKSTETETSPDGPLTIGEAARRRVEAIRNMVACIENGDFVQARRYSYEEIRIHKFIRQFQQDIPGDDNTFVWPRLETECREAVVYSKR
jgi:hypothetical protein